MSLWWLAMACTPQTEKRSVLLMMVEQVRADQVGAYGSLPTDTPNVDALAKNGTLFSRAYATSTLSGPARSSILTGEVPPVHGHRLDRPPADVEGRGWIRQLNAQGWDRCDIQIDASNLEKSSTKVKECAQMGSVVVVVNIAAGQMADVDQAIGRVSRVWNKSQSNGLGILVGVTGNMTGARQDAAILITDDLVRVPLVVWGHGWETDWEVSDVVSTVDIGSTALTELEQSTAGRSLKSGGSEVAYHESVSGYQAFGARPLFGFTSEWGRYVEGVHGRWYPAGKGKVRAFEDPESEYSEHAERLADLQTGFDRNVGLPSKVLSIAVDPVERLGLLSLVTKVERLMDRGQMAAADRILARISARSPDAPILETLRQRRNTQGVKP